jgi:GxxExxY protein
MKINHQEHQAHQDFIEPSKEINKLAKEIVDCCFCVHKDLGPGLLENAYEIFLLEEFQERGLNIKTQAPLKVTRKNKIVDMAYRLDFVVEDKIILEIKSIEKLLPLHEAQILTYLKLSKMKLGFPVNFNSPLIKDGIRRFAL